MTASCEQRLLLNVTAEVGGGWRESQESSWLRPAGTEWFWGFPTFLMKNATQHRSLTRPKVEQLGTKIFCLRVWFLNLAIWTCRWHVISECEFSNGTRITCDNQPFGIPLHHPMLKCSELGFSFLFFPLLPHKERAEQTPLECHCPCLLIEETNLVL